MNFKTELQQLLHKYDVVIEAITVKVDDDEEYQIIEITENASGEEPQSEFHLFLDAKLNNQIETE